MNIINEENRLCKILRIIEQSNLTSSQSIADKLGVSTKTVKNEIKELNRLLKGYALIDIKQGKYVLYVIDQQNFDIVRQDLGIQDDFFNSQQNRMSNILYKLMNSDVPYLTDDLAEEMNIGKTTFIGDLKKLRNKMEKYSLRIVGKTNTGLFLEGNEVDIRMCLLQDMYGPIYKEFKIDEDIIESISKICRENALGSGAIDNFIKFFTVMIDRLLNNHTIKYLDDKYIELKSTKTFEFVDKLLDEVEKIIPVKVPVNERIFMVLPIISMRTPINSQGIKEIEVSDETIDLVQEIITLIKSQMNITIMPGDFFDEFVYHMFFMINRVKFGIKIKNPILEDIKEKYSVAFKMAELSKCIIEDKLKNKVSKDEVGYMAMYFGVFISDNSYKNKIYRVAIICGSGVLTARIISSQLKKILSPESEIDIYSSMEVNDELLNKYDLICSTYKLTCDINTPIIYMKEIFDEHQFRKQIEQVKYTQKLEVPLLQGIDSILLNLLDEEKFFVLDNNLSYKENINLMVDALRNNGYVDDGFKERLKKREDNSTMVFDKYIAIPHVVNYESDNIVLALGVFDDTLAIDKDRNVKLVFLLGIPEELGENEILLIKIYNEIISIAKDKNKIKEISRLKKYKDLVLYKIKEDSTF
ncbi:BglG family transcription antiterminator [Terrisporobacter mayombei]|uniref:LicABCH operon regulator n=1 Tax=Terrisporobacter mayombei TaxID=1541 RepID=A0ABY9Q7N2_9FIRM|nr:PRD domain-containing protein [Terrisporobacter mayombei]MCC3869844.1 PRD domain-containing protein [Terrisporobacter mayombei]WMT83216.1 putative licABCH operon regulator [Terrisporobacter mayombei]